MADFIIADDDTPDVPAVLSPDGMSKGYVPRDYVAEPYGSLEVAAPFALTVFPRSEWDARIEEKEQKKNRLSDIRRHYGLKSQYQNGVPYCWIHAVASAMRLVRALNNQPAVDLSATSAGAQIKNFRQEGGWSTEGLKWCAEHGMAPAALWPENSFNRSYLTEDMKRESLKYRIQEWWDMQPRNFDQLITALLLNIPVAVGYNHWSHAICAMDAVKKNGQYGVRIWNSWGDDWGDQGEGLLLGGKAIADDQCAPRVLPGVS